MNIVFGLAIITSSIHVRRMYRPKGYISNCLFAISMAAAFSTLLSSPSFASFWLGVMTVIDVLCACGIVALYVLDTITQCQIKKAAEQKRLSAARMAMLEESKRQRACYRDFLAHRAA